MKKITLWSMLLVAVAAVGAQTPDDNAPNWLGKWEAQIASPSYGVSLMLLTVQKDNTKHDLLLPGIDVRIFNGTNVAKEGGFYTGLEVGTTQFLAVSPDENPQAYVFSDKTGGPSSVNYDVKVEGNFGMVYLMSKYGYRLELGFDLVGLSVGAELGLGARLSNGYVGLGIPIPDGSDTLVLKRYWGYTAKADLIIEANAQGALRLGKNFRLYGALGAFYTPEFFSNDLSPQPQPTITGAVDTESEARDLLQRYLVKTLPLIATARAGFSVSY